MGINAHSGAISALCVSYDGQYLFSAGKSDQSSYMYEVDLSNSREGDVSDSNNINNNSDSLTASQSVGETDKIISGSEIDLYRPFLSLLDGGEGGDLHEDIIEYFYYCQLRAQGEDSMEERTVSGRIPIEEISSLMRAVGFYPSEAQVVDMLNEVGACPTHTPSPVSLHTIN